MDLNDKENMKFQELEKLSRKYERQIYPGMKNELEKAEINKIIECIAILHGTEDVVAYTAMKELFLKGAATASCPETISTMAISETNKEIKITKEDIVYASKKVTGSKHIRRIAEALRNEISEYAERLNKNGDLALQINNKLLAEGKQPLTKRQKAWTSSFNQNNEKLENEEELKFVAQLLAQNYEEKFKSPKSSKKKREEKPVSNSNDKKLFKKKNT